MSRSPIQILIDDMKEEANTMYRLAGEFSEVAEMLENFNNMGSYKDYKNRIKSIKSKIRDYLEKEKK